MSAKPQQTDPTPEQLRDWQRKFTDGTATAKEKIGWLTHLKTKAQQQRNDERVLTLVQQLHTTQQDADTHATQPLPCPDGSPRQLMWIRTTDVRARRAPALPAPDSEALKELETSIMAQGVLQNLVLGPDHDVIAGEGRRQAARKAGVPYVPALVLSTVTDDEREFTALAVDLFARPRLSVRHLARYRTLYRTILSQEFLPRDARDMRTPHDTDGMSTVLDLVQAYHHLPEELQQEVTDLILEGNAARDAIQTALEQQATRAETASQVQTLHQRLKELDRRLAAVEGERNRLQDTTTELHAQMGVLHGQLDKARDDLTSVAEAADTHKHEASRLSRELHGLRARLTQLRPLEQLAETPHTIDLMGEAVQVIELVCHRLVRSLSAVLDRSTTATSTRECARVLDDIVAHATACKRALSTRGR